MDKNKNLIALASTILWLGFIYSAFRGFYYWYGGFILFFWISLGLLNYRHETSLWLAENRPKLFLKYYIFLFLFGLFADYVVGQKLTQLWDYPHYVHFIDWVRLYILIYPIGGLAVLELVYFIAGLLHERLITVRRPINAVGKLEAVLDSTLIMAVLLYLYSKFIFALPHIRLLLILLLLLWAVLATVKLKYHLRHWSHWMAILFITLFMSLFLHEIPNTSVYEWQYYNAPLFNASILHIPLWVFFGWYVLILLMLKFWMALVLRHRNPKER